MDDSQLIELYFARSELAVSETEKKYGAYCGTVASHILDSAEDAEECVNDTWLAAWNAIPPARPSSLGAFLAKLTRNISLDRLDRNMAQKRGGSITFAPLDELRECVGTNADAGEALDLALLGETVRRFVRSLPERSGNVFVRRYFFSDSVSEIAERYGLSENNVTVILSRCRRKLKKLLSEEEWIRE